MVVRPKNGRDRGVISMIAWLGWTEGQVFETFSVRLDRQMSGRRRTVAGWEPGGERWSGQAQCLHFVAGLDERVAGMIGEDAEMAEQRAVWRVTNLTKDSHRPDSHLTSA